MGKILKGLKTLAAEASGANLEPCPGKTDMGVRCKRKKKPGYQGCGSPMCDSSHNFK